MRLIIHMGFHKTASTYLQQLLALNGAELPSRGIWVDGDAEYGAHHPIANILLVGDADRFVAAIGRARDAGCHTMVLTSENLESLPFVPHIAQLIEDTAAANGIDTIEWHAVLREPGAYFESLMAQLAHHIYADGMTTFVQAMQKGVVFIPEPQPGVAGGTPYWFYCFDYHAYLTGFAAVGRDLYLYDYQDRDPYPGWRIIDRLGIADLMVEQPDMIGHNHRLPPEAVEDFYRSRVKEAIDQPELWARVREAMEGCMAASIEAVPTLADAVGERYADSYAQALAAYGPEARAARAA